MVSNDMRKYYDDINLSERLLMSLRMVDKTICVADVGCDHAHSDIKLLKDGTAQKCIAMDVRTGPLEKAEENLKQYGYCDKVDLRLSDGLDCLKPREAEYVIIAGMGGIVMRKILERGLGENGHLKDNKPVLVLQPQSHIYEIRKWLYDNGYEIVDEDMCFEYGKYYFAMKAVPEIRSAGMKEAELHFGPILLKNMDFLMQRYLEDSYNKVLHRLKQIELSDSKEAGEKREYFENLRQIIKEVRSER